VTKPDLVPIEYVEQRILQLRGAKVILDSDLAELYGVETKRLNEQVKRNSERFPSDFVFQLTQEEFENSRSHFATSSRGHGGRRTPPYAFTEHGAIMAANVLRSERAIEMSVFVVRAFVRLRGMLTTHKELAHTLDQLERKVGEHDEAIRAVVTAIRELTSPSSKGATSDWVWLRRGRDVTARMEIRGSLAGRTASTGRLSRQYVLWLTGG